MDDSVLISKKTEPVNPKLVKLKSKSSLDTFQKLVAKEILVDGVAQALMSDVDIETGDGAGAQSATGSHGKNEQKVECDGREIQSLGRAFSSSKKNYVVNAVKIAPENDEQFSVSKEKHKEGNQPHHYCTPDQLIPLEYS